MTLEQALTTHLETDGAVAGFLATKIYPIMVPQSAVAPYGSFQLISVVVLYAHDGPGPELLRVQIDIYALTHAQARAIADAVRTRMEGFRGTMGGAGGVKIGGVFMDSQADFWEAEARVYRITTDWFLWKEAA